MADQIQEGDEVVDSTKLIEIGTIDRVELWSAKNWDIWCDDDDDEDFDFSNVSYSAPRR